MAQTYEAISTTTLGSDQSTISLTSIPATYTDLVCVCVGFGSGGGGSIRVQANSDTANNYNTNYVYGTGSGASVPAKTGNTAGCFMGRIMTNSTDMGGGYFHIMNYASSVYGKSMIGQSFASAPIIWYSIGTWRSTAAITRLDLTVESGYPFASGFQVTLYGIKAA
jgi:hypothetical protein